MSNPWCFKRLQILWCDSLTCRLFLTPLYEIVESKIKGNMPLTQNHYFFSILKWSGNISNWPFTFLSEEQITNAMTHASFGSEVTGEQYDCLFSLSIQNSALVLNISFWVKDQFKSRFSLNNSSPLITLDDKKGVLLVNHQKYWYSLINKKKQEPQSWYNINIYENYEREIKENCKTLKHIWFEFWF